MRHGFDTSDPGPAVISGYEVAGGYLGGDTPHVWTGKQWADQPARWRAPFWVYDEGRDVAAQAADAVAAMVALGAPEGSAIILDMEALTQDVAVNMFADYVHEHHYCTMIYGSKSSLFGNPPRTGYVVADYTGTAHLYEHPHTMGTQYATVRADGGLPSLDLDVWADEAPLWDARPPAVQMRPPWATSVIEDLTDIITTAGAARAAVVASTR